MPRAVDRFQIEPEADPNRSGTEFHMAGLIADQTEIWAQILQQAAESFKSTLIAIIEELTGIDLSTWEMFLDGFADQLGLDNLGDWFSQITAAFSGIDLAGGPGAIIAAITAAIAAAISDLPLIGDIADLVEAIVLGGSDSGFPYTFPITFGGPGGGAANFFANLRAFFDVIDFADDGFDFDTAWETFIAGSPIGLLLGGVQDGFQAFLNLGWQALVNDDEGLIDRTAEEFAAALQNIPALNVIGVGAANMVDTITDIIDNFWSGLTRSTGAGKSIADVANAATETANMADTGVQIGEWNNAILGLRNNKSLMSGMDETEESTFLMSDLFTGTADPPNFAVTSAASTIGFWRATETAKKGFISWWGMGITSITGLYVDVYRMNYTTSEMELVHTSANQISAATSGWSLMQYFLPEADRIDVVSGDVLGVSLRVVGAGNHTIAGKNIGSWMTDHPTVVPARPAAVRTGTTDLAFGSITYSANMPWFGIGIVAGDAPPNYFAPRTTQFSTPGTFTYLIPDWANFIDGVYVGGGGGGCGGNVIAPIFGEGGDAGVWQGETLVRGIDFPVDATELTVTVGAGGSAGPGNTPGGAGGATTRAAIPSGKVALTATGGPGGNTQDNSLASGDSPGNFTFSSVTYIGGNGGSAAGFSNGAPGGAPGSGGGGGAGGTWGVSWPGGVGARGGAWMTARQT